MFKHGPPHLSRLTDPRRLLSGTLSRLRWERSGQAVTEFAIVVPLIVMVLLFAIWFYEVIQIKLKVQEAARYAAWEATGYQLHDYDEGRDAISDLSSTMTSEVTQDTIQRFANLNSTDTTTLPSNSIFAASWMPPMAVVTNSTEQQIYGGALVNMAAQLVGTLASYVMAWIYDSPNPIAMALVGAGKLDMSWVDDGEDGGEDGSDQGGDEESSEIGGGMGQKSMIFGSPSWGFNHQGYVQTRIISYVSNNWFQRGVQSYVLPNAGVLLNEHQAILADPWRLHTGDSVVASSGGTAGPGFNDDAPYWKQVDRMYFVNDTVSGLVDTIFTGIRTTMGAALAVAGISLGSMDEDYYVKTALVSVSHDGSSNGGTVEITEEGSGGVRYDTLPLGTNASSQELQKYGETVGDRGDNFMGCDREMSLGCPTATLQQDNPFGDYVYRE